MCMYVTVYVCFQKTRKSFNDRPENADQASPFVSLRETNSATEPEMWKALKRLRCFGASVHYDEHTKY